MCAQKIDYGSDITFDGEDISPSLQMTTDSSVVLEALAFRLQVDNGSFWYDNDFGFNIFALTKSPILLTGNGIGSVKTRIEQECLKDPRVKVAVCNLSEYNINSKNLIITIGIELKSGVSDTLVFTIANA